MKRALSLAVALLFAVLSLPAHAVRSYGQAELEALVAPIALYPDAVVQHALTASLYPQDIASAAAWQRANPELRGEALQRTVERTPWHPSAKALLHYPELLQRMSESPQWLADLAEAHVRVPTHVSTAVQELRARAYADRSPPPVAYVPPPAYGQSPAYGQPPVYVPVPQPVYVQVPQPIYVPQPVIVTRIVPHFAYHSHRAHAPHREARAHPREARSYRPVPESQRAPIIQSAPAVYPPPLAALPEPRPPHRRQSGHRHHLQ